ncbi:MAG: hypothetical protein JW882_12005 [Deltaproteobacteria bacterium]|nr:hypothetical protein [Deltaproteobacteria bacterium]
MSRNNVIDIERKKYGFMVLTACKYCKKYIKYAQERIAINNYGRTRPKGKEMEVMTNIIKIKSSPDIDCDKTCKGCEVPSRKEIEALDAMREIRDQVRAIKKKINDFSSSTVNQKEKANMEKEIIDLKEQWKEWDNKRNEAARVRMIMLGHEEP